MDELVHCYWLPGLWTVVEILTDRIAQLNLSGIPELERGHRSKHLRDRRNFVLRLDCEGNSLLDVGVAICLSEQDAIALCDEHGTAEAAHIGPYREILVRLGGDLSVLGRGRRRKGGDYGRRKNEGDLSHVRRREPGRPGLAHYRILSMTDTDIDLKAEVEGTNGILVIRGASTTRGWNGIRYKTG